MPALSSSIIGALALRYLHKRSKNKAIKKAVEKVRKEEVVTDKFYVLINDNKLDIVDPLLTKQDFLATIERIKSTIKAFNGINIIHTNTSIGTMVFFDMPSSSILPLEKQLKQFHPRISVGRAKNN
jgi:hypothetical protein